MPWALKSFEGREKSLLREATADLIPRSVYDRVKSPYPSTQDPEYAVALRNQAKDLLARPDHPAHSVSWSEPQELPSGGRVPYSRNASTLRCTHLEEP